MLRASSRRMRHGMPVSPLTGSRPFRGALTEAEPRQVLRSFTARFAHVFFTPGNHDLWVRRQERGQYDSVGELKRLCLMCELKRGPP